MAEENNDEDVELFEANKCKVKIKKSGDMLIECQAGADKIQISDTEVKMVSGISDIAKDADKPDAKTKSDKEKNNAPA